MTSLAYAPALLLILLPMLLFLLQSFFVLEGSEVVHRLSLENYKRFFSDGVYVSILLYSCLVALAATLVTILLGYPVALLLASLEGQIKYVLLLLFVIPLLMSYIIKIYAIRSILGGNGFLNRVLIHFGVIEQPITFLIFNLHAVALTLAILLLPFSILPIFITLDRIPRQLIEASHDLGATGLQTFGRIILPLSLRGTLVGASFTFILALGDFITPQMVGGVNGLTFGRIIYSQFGFAYNWPFGAALAVILLLFVAAIMIAISRLFGGGKIAT